MTELDKSFEALIEIEKTNSVFLDSELTESDTRSKILDKLLINVLGWTEYDIEREGWVRIGYFDYEIKTSTFQFVVEAKKNSKDFNLPTRGNEVKIKTIYPGNQDAIDQIRQYLIERGLAYGILTNGRQFIIGQFLNTQGTDWKEQKCVYFNGFEDIKKNFSKFYDLLSIESIVKYGKIKLFEKARDGKTIVKDVSLKRKNTELVRNQISQQLIPIINKVFEEIYNTQSLDEKELLKSCYVKNEDVKKYNSEIGFIFSDSPPTFDSRILPVQNTVSTHNQLSQEIFTDVNVTPSPIILIGTSGAGKTTFIKYFTEVVLSKREKKNRPIVYLDFRLFTSQTIGDTRYIYQKIIDQLETEYPELRLSEINILKTIYKSNIDRKKSGVWAHIINNEIRLNEEIAKHIDSNQSNSIEHLNAISNYLLTKCRKRICILFDNADQLNDADQKEVFLLSNVLNRNLKCITIISLREGYFYKWKDNPPLNAYQSNVYHITAPPYREVLNKRIRYVVDKFDFEEVELQTTNKNVKFQKGSLEHLFSNLYDTLFKLQNSEVMEFLEETSYPNTRQGLENFKSFLLSGHSKISEYMSFEYGDGRGIPIWEFFKSIALESNFYYDTRKSKIVNLFYPAKNNTNHFTKIRLLNHLFSREKISSKRNEFFNVEELAKEFLKCGYTIDIIIAELQELFDYKLVSTPEHIEDIEEEVLLNNSSMISITSIGIYYLKSLIGRFHYIDLVLQDTPIFDESSFNSLSSSFPESDEYGNRDLSLRKSAVEEFLKYLKSQEALDKKFTSNFDDLSIMFDVNEGINNSLEKDLKRISVVIEKQKN